MKLPSGQGPSGLSWHNLSLAQLVQWLAPRMGALDMLGLLAVLPWTQFITVHAPNHVVVYLVFIPSDETVLMLGHGIETI